MNIGIDIDDTLTCTSDKMLEYIDKYANGYVIEDKYSVIRGNFSTPEIETFAKKYLVQMSSEFEIKEGAREVIKKLREEGNKIYFITARTDSYYGDAYKFAKEFLEKNDIEFDMLIVGQHFKVEACKNNKIDVMFDDAIDTCESLNEIGIRGVVFNSSLNIEKETSAPRVNSWNELYNYVNNLK